jgi:hypothetical protein
LLSICLTKGDDSQQDKSPGWASRISKNLSQSYIPRRKTIPLPSAEPFAEESAFGAVGRESAIFEILAAWLALLLQKPKAFDLFGIVYTSLVLPEIGFKVNPIYSRVAPALIEQDIQHDHWFCAEGDISVAHVGKELSEMDLTSDGHFSCIIHENARAYQAVLNLLDLVDRGESIDPTKISLCSSAIDTQDSRLNRYFEDAQSSSISHALRVAALSKRCKNIINRMGQQGQSSKGVKDSERPFYLHCLLDCLRKVRMELELCQA